MDIEAWLHGLGLDRYAELFRANRIDFDVVPDLTDADLTALGVALGDRKRLLRATTALREPAPRSAVRPQAERRQLTVMFVDLVGSTALSAGLDPEEMREVLRDYLDVVAAGIVRFDGHVAKFLGDGVLAYFGFPQAHEDDAERAVRAGLEVLGAVSRLRTPDGEPLAARAGIATGLVVVGDLIGQGAAQEQTVVGDTPNLAARLQALAEPGTVVVAEATRRLLGTLFEFADLGPVEVKGLAGPIAAFRVAKIRVAESRFEALRGHHLTPMVGREHDLGLLLDRWRRACAGEGQVVLLTGEPGIGKSRLVQALGERLRGEALARLSCQCSPHHLQSALWPVAECLERAAGFCRDDAPGARLAKLETLLTQGQASDPAKFPLLATLLGLSVPDRHTPQELSPSEQRSRTLDALVRHLQSMAARRPVLAVLEDAHWGDPTTIELFDRLVNAIEGVPILLLMTSRPEFSPAWSGRPNTATVRLDRLSRRDAAALVGRVAGSQVLPADVIEQVVDRTDGVPLFVEELTKTVLESCRPRREGERLVVNGPSPGLVVPETLQDSLLARLDRLARAKEVAQIGAAIGREFSFRLLAAVAPLPEDRLSTALRELASAELIFVHGEPPESSYTFKHALVQDAAYSTLLKSRCRQLHARIVKALESDFPDQAAARPELVAHHAGEAGHYETAIGYWRKAGDQNSARAAMKEANALYGQALELIEKLPAGIARDRTELGLLLALGGAQQAVRGSVSPECGRTYTRARELAEQVGEAEDLVEILKGLMYFHHGRTELDEAGAAAAERLRVSTRLGRPREVVAAYDDLATVSFSTGAFEDALSLCSRAEDVIRDATSETSASDLATSQRVILILRSQALTVLGYRDRALAACDQAMDMARAMNHDYSLVTTLGNVCFVDQVCGRYGMLAERTEEMIKVSADRAFPTWLARGLIFRGWLSAVHLHESTGLPQMREGLAKLHAIGAKVWRPYYLGLLAVACGAVGQPRTGLAALDEAMTLIEPAGEKDHEAELHRIRGTLTLACGDRSAAETCFMRALSVARRQEAKTWELRAAECLARLWAENGERAEARDLLAPVHAWFTEGFDGPDLQRSAALLAALG